MGQKSEGRFSLVEKVDLDLVLLIRRNLLAEAANETDVGPYGDVLEVAHTSKRLRFQLSSQRRNLRGLDAPALIQHPGAAVNS